MTEYEELLRDYNNLYRQNNELKARIRQQDIIIKQLRSTLANLGVDAVIEAETADHVKAQRGRPQAIDETTRERIRILKKEGLSYREISRKEGVSLGMISTQNDKCNIVSETFPEYLRKQDCIEEEFPARSAS